MKDVTRQTIALLAALVLLAALAPARALAQGDSAVIEKIVEEGRHNSKVWDHLTHLSEEIGTRLTGSTRCDLANAWTRDQFRSFGCSNVRLWKWGEIPVRFDRGPSSVRITEPVERELEFTTRSWSAGTPGPVTGPVLKAPEDDEALEAMGESVEGAWILSLGRARGDRRGVLPANQTPPLSEELAAKLHERGILGIITAAREDIVVTGGERGWRELDPNNLPNQVAIYVRRTDYDVINSRLADGESVTVEADLQNNFVPGPIPLYNTIAEIPGIEHPEQIVIVSAHLDSWDGPGSMGSQDNGTGSSVTLEAARLLMAAGAKPKRTIRFILWTGEEQGLLGSQAYVDSLSDEEKANISAVFVDDGGTNYEGGVSCIAEQQPMLAAAIAPVQKAFPEFPMTLDVRDRMSRFGGSDHAPFVRAGIPAYFWMEEGSGGREGKDYRFIHHTQYDTPRYAVPEYLVQSAVCAAVTAYNLACADTMLPREPERPETEESESPSEGAPSLADDPTFIVAQGPMSGVWSAERAGDDGNARPFTLLFEHSADGRVRGWMESERGQTLLEKVTFDQEASKASFSFTRGYGTISYEAALEGEAMQGTMSREGEVIASFTAKRRADRLEQVAAAEDEDSKPAENAEAVKPAEKANREEATPAAPMETAAPQPVTLSDSLTGRWDAVFTSDNASPESGFVLIFEPAENGAIVGRLESQLGSGALRDLAVRNDERKVTFVYDTETMGAISFAASLDEMNLLQGTLGVGDELSLPFKAERAKATANAD